MQPNIEELINHFKAHNYRITRHGYEELDKDQISTGIIEAAIADDSPEIIENYPQDSRGHSCLVLGWCEPDVPIHLCIGISGDMPEIITGYRPNSLKFNAPEFRKRKNG